MRVRLLAACVTLLILPLLVSTSDTGVKSGTFVAVAGRTQMGSWCDACTPGCILEPGEPTECSNNLTASDDPVQLETQDAKPDPSAGGMLVTLAMLMIGRMVLIRAL